MPDTIGDLNEHGEVKRKVEAAELKDKIALVQKRIDELLEARREENKLLEAAGYNYDGREEFAQMMERAGR